MAHVDPIPTREDMRAVPLRALTRAVPLRALTRASRVHTIILPLKQSGPTNLLLGIALSSVSALSPARCSVQGWLAASFSEGQVALFPGTAS